MMDVSDPDVSSIGCRPPVEVYFELEENEVERFERALSRPEFKEAKRMATSHVDRILEEGRREGRNEGVLQGKLETLLRQLRGKFGVFSDELESEIAPSGPSRRSMPCSTRCSSRARSKRWIFPGQSGAADDKAINENTQATPRESARALAEPPPCAATFPLGLPGGSAPRPFRPSPDHPGSRRRFRGGTIRWPARCRRSR